MYSCIRNGEKADEGLVRSRKEIFKRGVVVATPCLFFFFFFRLEKHRIEEEDFKHLACNKARHATDRLLILNGNREARNWIYLHSSPLTNRSLRGGEGVKWSSLSGGRERSMRIPKATSVHLENRDTNLRNRGKEEVVDKLGAQTFVARNFIAAKIPFGISFERSSSIHKRRKGDSLKSGARATKQREPAVESIRIRATPLRSTISSCLHEDIKKEEGEGEAPSRRTVLFRCLEIRRKLMRRRARAQLIVKKKTRKKEYFTKIKS